MKNCLLIFLSFFFLVSCETVIDVDLPTHEPRIVINSVLGDDDTLRISVTNSLGILDTGAIAGIVGADVKLYENDVFIANLILSWEQLYWTNDSIAGDYISMHTVVPGATYRVEVSAAGYAGVSAVTTVPHPVPIKSHQFVENAYTDPNGNVISELSVVVDDPAGIENYYFMEVIDTAETSFGGFYFLDSKDPSLMFYTNGGIVFSDELFDGKTYTFKAELSEMMPIASSIKVALRSMNKDYFLYLKTKELHIDNEENPFAEPVQVYTNVEGGLGIFGGFSVDSEPLY